MAMASMPEPRPLPVLDAGGFTASVDAFAWDPNAGQYNRVPAGTSLQGGPGYWAFFPAAQQSFPW